MHLTAFWRSLIFGGSTFGPCVLWRKRLGERKKMGTPPLGQS